MLWFRHNGSPQNHLVWLTNVVESLLSRIHHSPTHRSDGIAMRLFTVTTTTHTNTGGMFLRLTFTRVQWSLALSKVWERKQTGSILTT